MALIVNKSVCSSYLKCSALRQTLRTYVIKRKYPIDPSQAEALPVYQYPVRDENVTSVHVWGCGEHGALGSFLQKKSKMKGRLDGRFRQFNRPLRLTFAENHHVTDVAAGYGFTLFAVKGHDGDRLFGCGINSDSQIGVHEPRRDAPLGLILSPVPVGLPKKKIRIRRIGAGRAHSVVVTTDGQAYTLGNNAYGQCGRPVIEGEDYTGNNIVHCIPHLDGESVYDVECGQDHTLLLTESGRVFSCGWGADGQTGLAHYNNCGRPSPVVGDIQGEKIVKISSKADCVLALNDKGDVFGWGNSEYSQLFDEDSPHQQVNRAVALTKCRGFGRIIDVAAAGSHCLMLNEEGDVFSWGYGILGQGPAVQQSWTPRQIPSLLFGRNEFSTDSKVTSVATGLYYNAAITNHGDLYTWGKNRTSCLGLGDEKDQFFPLRVALGLSAVRISLAVDHSVCITKSG